MRSVVVLPQPDGPSSETSSPFATSRSMPATTSRPPSVLRSPRTASPPDRGPVRRCRRRPGGPVRVPRRALRPSSGRLSCWCGHRIWKPSARRPPMMCLRASSRRTTDGMLSAIANTADDLAWGVQDERVHLGRHRHVRRGADQVRALRLVEGGQERHHHRDEDARPGDRQVTCQNVRQRPAPASRAASSRERGTAENAAAGIHVMNTTMPRSGR